MIRFELVTLDGIKFAEDVYEVMLPTPDGQIAVLPMHSPIVSLADTGIIAVRRQPNDPNDRLEYFATNGGVIEIADNAVRVLADTADREDEINEQEALKAFEEAQSLLKSAKDRVELEHAQALVDRSQTRLRVAELRRHSRRSH